ncbi:MAG TPA: ester cyclase [Candidatus Dormibacteraeota bacterium]
MIRAKYKKSDIDQAIKEYKEAALPALATHKGNRSGTLLVDRDSGESISIGIYDDEASAKSFAPKAEKLVESFKKYLSTAEEPKRELFEIAASTQMEARAVVERGIKAFNAHDLEAVARDTAADVVLEATGGIKAKGTQAAKEFNQTWLRAFPDARVEAKSIITQGSTVVVEGVFTGTHDGPLRTPMGEVPPTGKKLVGEFIQVFEIDRGLVKRNHIVYDQVDVMTQLGMAPTPAGAKSRA